MALALVTGASGGLGREICLMLLKMECRVIALYHSSDISFLEYFQGYSKKVTPFKVNLSERSEIGKVMEDVGKRFAVLDYVVNCAGVTRDALLIKCPESEWDEVFSVNLSGPFYVIKYAVPLLKLSDKAHILNISSVSGVKGKRGMSAYSASKAALNGLTFSAAHELAQYDIRVNALLPGYMETSMGKANVKAMEKAVNDSVLNCLSSPAEVSAFVYSVLTLKGVTGQVFTLDSRV